MSVLGAAALAHEGAPAGLVRALADGGVLGEVVVQLEEGHGQERGVAVVKAADADTETLQGRVEGNDQAADLQTEQLFTHLLQVARPDFLLVAVARLPEGEFLLCGLSFDECVQAPFVAQCHPGRDGFLGLAHVNRVKRIKRDGYGRAGFHLLRRQIILSD
ncbi:hypothetical protein OTB20_39330 [Streptomyces sp. H27-H1]|uniref:hypothetical protein n=1 Tax=Streptomyces sp. H27-H1 TaxID=2996461 RepID=UPI00226DB9CA|nr:hypothetical protein [Streptomyces sp. H27-H1]MCY0932124.1 hypothetical protein [Streptomyces sp. H27-H1]